MIVSQDGVFQASAKHLTTQAKSDEQNFIHDEIGYNYRLTNMQEALGLAQMEQLENFIVIKTDKCRCYCQEISSVPRISMAPFCTGIRSNHRFMRYAVMPPIPTNPSS